MTCTLRSGAPTVFTTLGSDCAFFIYNTPMLATGRGEILQPVAVNLSGYALLLVKPPLSVSTAEAYAGVSPKAPAADLRSIVSQGVEAWREALVNDFEPSIFAKYPLLADVKKALYGCGARYAAIPCRYAVIPASCAVIPSAAERLGMTAGGVGDSASRLLIFCRRLS